MPVDRRKEPRARHNVPMLVPFTALIAILVLYAALNYFNLTIPSISYYFLATGVVGIIVTEIISRIIYQYFIKGITSAEARTLADLFRILAYIIVMLLLLTILVGLQNLTGFLVGAGFLGIVLGLAAQSTLSNFISGVYLLASKAFEPNDNVMILAPQYTVQPQSYPHDRFTPGFVGVIENIGLLYTKLVNEEGVPFYVPNSVVSQSLVINYRRAKEHSRRIQFDLDAKIPFKKVEGIVGRVMKKSKVDSYRVDVEYFHIDFYVVTIHVMTTENIRSLKSDLFTALIKDLHRYASSGVRVR